MSEKSNLPASFMVLALYGAVLAGLAGLGVGILGFFNADWTSAGVGFGAAGVTFGLLANALIRR